jgi:PAS domain S-box-containing protein
LTGYTFEEYVATGGWLGHIHPDDVERDLHDMSALHQNKDVRSEIRTFAKNGEIRWERIFAHPVWDEEKNRLKGIVGAVQDVTSARVAEDKLKETLLQQSAILNGIPDTAWLKDKNSLYIAVNEQFARTAGMKVEDVIGRSDFEIWQKEFAEHYRANDLEVMQTGRRMHMEELQIDSAGREYWVETVKTPIRNADGEVIGTTGIAREITERKKAEVERETDHGVKAKNMNEQFTYAVSHDLKSFAIVGFILEQMLVKAILKGTNRMSPVSAGGQQNAKAFKIVELSRIGRLMNPPSESVYRYCKETLDLVRGQIEAGNVTIELCDIEGVYLNGDRTRLIEVIQNLVDNAVKFMSRQSNSLVRIGSMKNAANERIFFVQDNGIGIAHEYHERIFGLFNKLNTNTEGTGIGLTLVKRIIEVHGGRIWVESQPAQGATFYFTLE